MPPAEEVGDRRVRRSRRALRDALVDLIVERGYQAVGVDDITTRADVARATFYSHYADKDDLLTAIFTELIDDLGTRITYPEGPWTTVRANLTEDIYRHAEENRSVYLACLGGAGEGRGREAYVSLISDAVERNYRDRVDALGLSPRVPVAVMARAVAGAHTELLWEWLIGRIDCSVEEIAAIQLNLMLRGTAWGQGTSDDQFTHTPVPQPDAVRVAAKDLG